MDSITKETPFYAGEEFADLSRHDGGLRYAVGTSNYQVMRANRTNPRYADNFGFTYNHAPMITYWKGHFYVQYLCNPVSEHTGMGMSLICRSAHGINWEQPKVSFPVIKIPAGTYYCSDSSKIEVPEEKHAFMHQRMGFYQAPNGKLLVSGFYGHSPHYDINPWENYGIGRVVREVYENGELGPIFFIRFLSYSGWTEDKLPFPVYHKSSDKGFVEACESLLSNNLYTQQWAEEHGDLDECVTFKTNTVRKEKKRGGFTTTSLPEAASSFCWYHISESTVIGLWKQSVVGRSDDGGYNWTIKSEPTFATSGAKSWGQKTEDGKYAIAYVNSLSSGHRYPLVVVTSEDGIKFDNMATVFGEVPPRRYEGTYKDFGPQYVRGICEGNPEYPKGAMWLTHSVNKEDIFVTRVPVPVVREVTTHVNDDFSNCEDGYIADWNIYSPIWAPVRPIKLHNGITCMRIADRDPCDYAKAMRIFPNSKKVCVSLDFMCARAYDENLEIELADARGIVACRVLIGGNKIQVRYASNNITAFSLSPEVMWHNLLISADCTLNVYKVALDGETHDTYRSTRLVHKVNSLERLVIRTKPIRYLPNNEIYPSLPDMENADNPIEERVYYITNVKTFNPEGF
jgi:hypothetical protein